MLQQGSNKEKCQKVWTSYGVTTYLILYLDAIESTSLQLLNQFWYKVAISRVLVSATVDHPLYMICQMGTKFRSTIFRYYPRSSKFQTIVDYDGGEKLNFRSLYCVQVHHDSLYGFLHRASPTRLVKYSNLRASTSASEVSERECASPPQPRGFPSLVNFRDRFIFVSGGCSHLSLGQNFASVDLYDIELDSWVLREKNFAYNDENSGVVPCLNTARMNHSSCVLNHNWIYTFGGINGRDVLDTFERLNVNQLLQ